MASLESLKQQIDALAEQLHRQSKVVADTGRRLITIEIDRERKSLGDLPSVALPEGLAPPKPSGSKKGAQAPKEEDEDGNAFIRGDDIVELVTELQGQLDLLENRGIRRQANIFATEDSDLIAALPGTDNSIPGEQFSPEQFDQNDEQLEPFYKVSFPKTLGEFRNLSQEDVETWCRFYELLPPDETEFKELLSQAGTTLESLDLELDSSLTKTLAPNRQTGDQQEDEKSSAEKKEDDKESLSKEESDAHFDELARFLGLRLRRTKGVW